jgi:hypothetical protein
MEKNLPSGYCQPQISYNCWGAFLLGLNLNNNISIIFSPQNQEFHYTVVCELNETFEQIEKKLYKEYPILENKNLTFLCKGNLINNKKKTLAELNIKNSDIIIFYDNL